MKSTHIPKRRRISFIHFQPPHVLQQGGPMPPMSEAQQNIPGAPQNPQQAQAIAPPPNQLPPTSQTQPYRAQTPNAPSSQAPPISQAQTNPAQPPVNRGPPAGSAPGPNPADQQQQQQQNPPPPQAYQQRAYPHYPGYPPQNQNYQPGYPIYGPPPPNQSYQYSIPGTPQNQPYQGNIATYIDEN